jgi:integrase
VGILTTDDFARLLAPIWLPKAETAGQVHRVPLSEQAVQHLEKRAMLRDGSLVFSNRSDTPLSDMTLIKQLRTCKFPSHTPGRIATAHGFRSSFRDWASENGYPCDLAARALAHTIHNATEAANHRTDQLEQRVVLMQTWADFVAPPD